MSPEAAPSTTTVASYTTLHLSATSFVYPPNAPDIRHCACKATATEAAAPNQSKLIRVYHTEPSVYAYNQGCYLIRETRYSTELGWHAPGDDLVADDAIFGSPVASLGWWRDGGQGDIKVWESKVYYIDKAGKLRERTNWSHFAPEVKESFDTPLPDPGNLIPPTPGWTLTPLDDAVRSFPTITPLPTSKLAAVRTEDQKIRVFYQASDEAIREIVWDAQNGWAVPETNIGVPEKAKQGTPLTVVSGGWSEIRVFYVGPDDLLQMSFSDENLPWTYVALPPYTISPTAMLTAVAYNYASPYFEMRLYSTDDKDELYEISFSRSTGGWTPLVRSVSTTNDGDFAPASRSGTSLSAVAGVIVDDSWVTKVYFHPRRIIGEWDLCTKVATYSGIPKKSEGAAARRQVEEETRTKIKQEEDRRAEEERARKAREEAERQAREEAERKAQEEAERKAKEEAERKANELPNTVTLSNPIAIVGSLQGAPSQVDDEFYELNLDFSVSLYGHKSSKLWITDNGMMCLDDNTNARAKRTGQKLPYRDGIPTYSILPFWTDLLIVGGKPHGVYYEVTGQAPDRVLVVEWYVTRYRQEDQYFHFNVKLEEAKPDVVEFKYYDAVDKGAECSIGVQGPQKFLQFSYNQAKVVPGLRLVFDTARDSLDVLKFEI